MAKYVCDFGEVNRIGTELCSLAEELKGNISSFDSQITSDLSTWNGDAKSSFQGQCSGQVENAISQAEYANELGEFIKNAASSIEQLESELASSSI